MYNRDHDILVVNHTLVRGRAFTHPHDVRIQLRTHDAVSPSHKVQKQAILGNTCDCHLSNLTHAYVNHVATNRCRTKYTQCFLPVPSTKRRPMHRTRGIINDSAQPMTIVSSPSMPTAGGSIITPRPRPSSSSRLTSGLMLLCPLVSRRSRSASLWSSVMSFL